MVERALAAARAGGYDDVDAANRLVEELYDELSGWIGGDGCATILRRAVEDVAQQHPEFVAARVVVEAEGDRERARLVVEGAASPASRVAMAAVLVRFIERLGRFIGDEMATRLTMVAWHQISQDEPEEGERSR